MIGIPVNDGTVACPECGLGFKDERRVATHFHRVHSRKIQVPNEGGKKVTASKKPARSGKPWTKAQHRKFKKTMKEKRNGALPTPSKSVERLQQRLEKLNKEPIEDHRDYVRHCPRCGEEMEPFYMAAGVLKRKRHGDY